MRLDVPDGFTATAGGVPMEDDASGDVVWDSGMDMRLPAFAVANFDTNVIDWDVPVEVSIAEGLGDRELFESKVVNALTFLESQYGPFPYERLGISVMTSPDLFNQPFWNTPTRLVTEGLPSEALLLQELSWQWAGMAVAEADERDVWLFMGLSNYVEALWAESVSEDIDADVTTRKLDGLVPDVTRTLDTIGSDEDLQDEAVHNRATLFLHALRLQIGDDAFFTTVREFIQRNLHQDVVVDDFRAVAEEVSGQDLDQFFTAWISEPEVPELPESTQP
jgi:hypothetical protein